MKCSNGRQVHLGRRRFQRTRQAFSEETQGPHCLSSADFLVHKTEGKSAGQKHRFSVLMTLNHGEEIYGIGFLSPWHQFVKQRMWYRRWYWRALGGKLTKHLLIETRECVSNRIGDTWDVTCLKSEITNAVRPLCDYHGRCESSKYTLRRRYLIESTHDDWPTERPTNTQQLQRERTL